MGSSPKNPSSFAARMSSLDRTQGQNKEGDMSREGSTFLDLEPDNAESHEQPIPTSSPASNVAHSMLGEGVQAVQNALQDGSLPRDELRRQLQLRDRADRSSPSYAANALRTERPILMPNTASSDRNNAVGFSQNRSKIAQPDAFLPWPTFEIPTGKSLSSTPAADADSRDPTTERLQTFAEPDEAQVLEFLHNLNSVDMEREKAPDRMVGSDM